MADDSRRPDPLARVAEAGGLRDGLAAEVGRETGLPEADVYGAASFYHLTADPAIKVRVCDGLSCRIAIFPLP